jgi:hypothetical protein
MAHRFHPADRKHPAQIAAASDIVLCTFRAHSRHGAGETNRSSVRTQQVTAIATAWRDVIPLIVNGSVKPIVERVYPFGEAGEALRHRGSSVWQSRSGGVTLKSGDSVAAATRRATAKSSPPVLPDESSPFGKNKCLSEIEKL